MLQVVDLFPKNGVTVKIANHLSPQEQEILLLRFEERLSYSEIADVLKIKEASCRSRLMRAKAHLLNLYEKEKIL